MKPKHPVVSGIEWILEHTRDPSGRPWSQRSLSLAAGLSHSHVNQLIKGTIAPGGLGNEALTRIAALGGVTVAWLLGEGRERVVEIDPEASRAPFEPDANTSRKGPGRWQRYAERYWTFSARATVALARGVPEAALDAASDFLGGQKGDGPTEVDAAAAISRYARLITEDEPEGREADDDEFEVPKTAPVMTKRKR